MRIKNLPKIIKNFINNIIEEYIEKPQNNSKQKKIEYERNKYGFFSVKNSKKQTKKNLNK
jgi:hypothetical protein